MRESDQAMSIARLEERLADPKTVDADVMKQENHRLSKTYFLKTNVFDFFIILNYNGITNHIVLLYKAGRSAG